MNNIIKLDIGMGKTKGLGKSQIVINTLMKRAAELKAKHIKDYGFAVDYIFPSSHSDVDGGIIDYNIYTTGLMENYGHPELQICFAASGRSVMAIFHHCAKEIKGGRIYTPDIVDVTISPLPTYILKVTPELYRLIVPTPDGKYLKEDVPTNYARQYSAFPDQFGE